MIERARIGAVILAAGQSSRYRAADPSAASKVVATLDGKPLVRHVAEAALAARLDPIVVVTGFAREHVENSLEGLNVRFVHNAAFATGLASSLKAGVAALGTGVSGVAILLADMPMINGELIAALARAFAADTKASALVPVRHGQRGNPVFISEKLFGEIAKLEGDAGARPLLKGRSDVLEVPVDDEGIAFDVDTPEALERFRL